MVDWFMENIEGSAIEIGAGHGALGRALNIPVTDSRLHELPEIVLFYDILKLNVIRYPADVEGLDAEEAITKYSPDTVIGGFIPEKPRPWEQHGNVLGVDEYDVIKRTKKYMLVLNLQEHRGKRLLNFHQAEYKFPWIVTSSAPAAN